MKRTKRVELQFSEEEYAQLKTLYGRSYCTTFAAFLRNQLTKEKRVTY
jgi:hypothetical protein